MAHMLDFNKDGSARMFSANKIVPWHQLGVVLSNPPNSSEAIKSAGMAWAVEKRPLFWEVPPKASEPDVFKRVQIPNRVALVRNEDEKLLAVVSTDYKVLQNDAAFAWFDPIVAAGQATYETAGVMCEGRKVWIMAKLNNQIAVNGDEYKQYMLLTNGHDGQTGITISPVNTRVVCNNTMRIALAEGNTQWFTHSGDLAMKLERAKAAYALAQVNLTAHNEILERLAVTKMDSLAIDIFLDDLLKIEAEIIDEANIVDGETTQAGTKYQLAVKENILKLHEDADDGNCPQFKGTAYGVFNAITNHVDHYSGARSRDSGNYQLFGDGQKLKERAFEGLTALATV